MAAEYSPGLVDDKETGTIARSDSLRSNAEITRLEKDGDQALKFLADRAEGEVITIDAETNRRLLRKIDLHIMPLMCIIYGLNFLDKTTLSYASVMGLQADLGLVGNDYQWLSSMFYFGYLAWEFPANRLLQVLPLAKFSAFNVIMWGITLTLFSTATNWSGAMAVRFFLGLFESAVTPGFALFTTQWYTRKEQGFRTSIWFCFNGFAQVFGGLVAYGIAHGAETHGFSVAPWKIIFIFTGTLTIVVGIVFLFIMPDSPLTTRWLSERDRVLVLERVRINQQGIGNKQWKINQFKEALRDPMIWAFAAFALLADIPNGGITNFFSLLLKSFGYTAEQSLLYGTPAGAVEIVALLLSGYLGDRLGQRIAVSACFFAVALLGAILIVAIPRDMPVGRLVGFYLTQAFPAGFVALLSLISSNIAGYTKKTTCAAIYLIAYCVGNLIGPQTFQSKDAPDYRPAEITIVVCWALCLLDLLYIRWHYQRANTKKEALRSDATYTKVANTEWMDLTDFENPEFVYTI